MAERIKSIEREALMALYGAEQLLEKCSREFRDLSRRTKNGYRDIRLVEVKLNKLIDHILETVPEEQLRTVQRHMGMSEIRVVTKNYTGKYEDDWLISREDVFELTKAAAERCMTCENTTGKGCAIARLLDELPIDVVNGIYIGCR